MLHIEPPSAEVHYCASDHSPDEADQRYDETALDEHRETASGSPLDEDGREKQDSEYTKSGDHGPPASVNRIGDPVISFVQDAVATAGNEADPDGCSYSRKQEILKAPN